MSPQTLIGVALSAALAGSLVLLVAALRGWTPQPAAGRNRRRIDGVSGRRAGYAIGAGLLVAVVTRWPVAAGATAVLVWWWPKMFGAARASSQEMDRLEGLTTWTESLRDTIAGSIGLEQAIPATVDVAPPALQPSLQRLSGMLASRVPLQQALARFAEELDDPSGDLVIAALILNSRLRGPGLGSTLTALATTAREELEMRRRVEQGRRSIRQSAMIIVTVTLIFAAGLAVFSRSYVAPYSTVSGQVMLAVVIGVFAIGFMWLRKLATAQQPERFLASSTKLAEAGSRSGVR